MEVLAWRRCKSRDPVDSLLSVTLTTLSTVPFLDSFATWPAHAREMANLHYFALCVLSHVLVLSLLYIRRWQLSHQTSGTPAMIVPATTIKILGFAVAIGTLLLSCHGPDDPLQECGTRVACFFYAFKLLDLALTRSETPPRLLNGSDEGGSAAWAHARHVWLLLTEMRYHAFDIHAAQKGRPTGPGSESLAHRLLPPVVTSVLAYIFPMAGTRCLLLLCVIQNGLEAIHTLLHPGCPDRLFYKPFAAATLGDFWTTHWHASAVFLQTLAYKPGRKLVGRWFGVLTAFALSGVWHGWAAMPLVEDDSAVKLGLQVCLFFFMLGAGTLLERLVWGERQGGWLQRIAVWAWALMWAGFCFRTLECHSRVPLLRDERCRT